MTDEEQVNDEGTAADAAVAAPEAQPEPAAPTNPNFKWYVVHTHTGFENRAKASLMERVRQLGMEEAFGEVLIPTEQVVEMTKSGNKRRSQKKFFPGYMMVQMELNDETWHVVKDTPKVTGFVGNAQRPPSIPEREVRKLTQQIDDGTLKTQPKQVFVEGESVRIKEGNFATFTGSVESVDEERSKLRVLIQIFGRPTPVELDFNQVEKV